ncbi:MAG: YicC family protein [Lachnospiraceae bacterium]|nr:YicC family protein [Lachnospiraceae bacterium]
MVRSMTGFGRAEVVENNRRYTVELKSVNHRYLDLSVKSPRALACLEGNVRAEIKKYLSRGKVDVFISYENMDESTAELKYNRELASKYVGFVKEISGEFGLENDLRAVRLASFPDVLEVIEEQDDEEELWAGLKKAVDAACEKMVEARSAEGENLVKDLTAKLDNLLTIVDFIQERSPKIVEEYREKIYARVKEILGDQTPDEGRLLTEVTVFADKVCVDEEIVRLRSHIETMKKELSLDSDVGRKLDFIAQEMNREANTTLSKTTDLEISNKGIELKTEIEKIREQIQNIE